jgi:hypothetical protein
VTAYTPSAHILVHFCHKLLPLKATNFSAQKLLCFGSKNVGEMNYGQSMHEWHSDTFNVQYNDNQHDDSQRNHNDAQHNYTQYNDV